MRRRRGGRIDQADESLFSGEVLTGRMAAERGLIDGIGELRAVMRAALRRQGQAAPGRHRAAPAVAGAALPFGAGDPLAAIGDVAEWIEARVLWARYGL